MDQQADPQWLTWTKRLQAIAQTGLTFTRDHYDHQRYEELQAIAAEMMAAGSGMPDSQKVLDLFRGEIGYATPKVEVRGAVVRENQILLVREREDGGWTHARWLGRCGRVAQRHGSAGGERGVGLTMWRHESWRRYSIATSIPIRRSPTHAYKLFFLCDLLGGEATPSFETPEVGFFRRHELPHLSAPRITEYQIEHMFEHAAHPEWPTTFD